MAPNDTVCASCFVNSSLTEINGVNIQVNRYGRKKDEWLESKIRLFAKA